jgi:hypothetical protein
MDISHVNGVDVRGLEKGAVAALIKASSGEVELTLFDGRVVAHGGELGVDELANRFAGGPRGGNNEPMNKPMMKTKAFFGAAPPPNNNNGVGRQKAPQDHGYLHVADGDNEDHRDEASRRRSTHHDEPGSDHEHESDEETGAQVRVLKILSPEERKKEAERKQMLSGMFGSVAGGSSGPKKTQSLLLAGVLPEHEYDSEGEFI